MSFPVFDDPWFAEIINRFSPEGSHDTAEAIDALSRCLLAASCIVAQAIDGLAREIKDQHQE